MKRVNLKLSDEVHRLVKATAAQKGTTIQDFCETAVIKKLPNPKPQYEQPARNNQTR